MASAVSADAPPRDAEPAGIERVRRGLVPLVAFFACCLGLACLLNLADLARAARDLSLVNDRFVGWAGVGGFAALSIGLAALLAAPRLGAAVPLAVGAAAAVFGLALGASIFDDVQLALALVVLGVATGGLLGAAVCLTLEAAPARRSSTMLAWGFPLVAAVPVLDWLALDVPTKDTVRLTLHPPVWPLAAVSVLLVGWSALTLVLEPGSSTPRAPAGEAGEPFRSAAGTALPLGWEAGQHVGPAAGPASVGAPAAEGAWTALLLAAALPMIAVMLLGFQPDIEADWLRPLVIVLCAVVVLGLGFACFSMPSPGVRLGYSAVGIVLLCWPPGIGLLLLTSSSSASATRLTLGVALGAIAVGTALSVWRPDAGVVGGLLVLAAGAAGAWVLPAAHLLLAIPVAAMAGGAAAAVFGGLRFALESPLGVRLVGGIAISTAVLGVGLALPLTWALGGDLPASPQTASADVRVFLGLTFAAAVLGAGYAATLTARADSPNPLLLDRGPSR